MKQEKNHSNKQYDPDELSDHLLSRAEIPWKKSKAEVWNDLEKHMAGEDKTQVPVRRILPAKQWLAMAASLLLLLSVTAFMRFYAVKSFCPQGVHTSLELPDGSNVELNASTYVKYHPYWWFISREVELDGEAFFQVEEGRKFSVVSSQATTEVLGTTFNVYARGPDYIVSCHTGRVRITEEGTNESITLSPEEKTALNPTGGFTVTKVANQRQEPGWTDNLLMFASTPLQLVFEEIERQYGIRIETPADMQQVYSGNFSLDQSVENILSLLCLPFDLNYEHQTGNKYKVSPSGK